MKTIILNRIVIIAILSNLMSSKLSLAQKFEWTRRAGLYAFDLGYGVGTDYAGNVYISGKYERDANFSGTTVKCAGNHDIYTAKYTSGGSLKWVKTAGGSIGDYSHAMVTDKDGNTYTTGEFEVTTYFGSASIKSNGNNDIFVAKYDTDGGLVWVRKVGGGDASDKALGISLYNDKVYLTGQIQGAATMANGSKLVTAGGKDIFLVCYSIDGNYLWGKRAGGSGDDEGAALANDPQGNVYMTGYFNGTADFGGQSLSSYGGTDAFIAKYSPDGNIIWVKKAGATAMDYGMGIKADSLGRVYWTGGFRLTSNFGGLTVKAPGGSADIFVASYKTEDGSAVWVRRAGGQINDYGRALALDAASNIYITGNFGLSATFDTQTITGVDSTEVYFASYDKDGKFRWVLQAGGQADDPDYGRFIEMGLSIATDRFGNVYASGTYRSPSKFGTTTLDNWDHTDIFLTKISQGGIDPVPPPSGTGSDLITPSGNASFCDGGNIVLKTSFVSGATYQWRRNEGAISGATSSSYTATSSGSYSVVVTNGATITESNPVNVTETVIATSISPKGTIGICPGGSVTFKVPDNSEYAYKWKKDGTYISGAIGSWYTAATTGVYQARITDGNCTKYSSKVTVQIQSCTSARTGREFIVADSLMTEEDSVAMKVYPNPNNGMFTFELKMTGAENGGSSQVDLEMINAIGQVIYARQSNLNNGRIKEYIELDGNILPGIYIIRIRIGNRVSKSRVMLAR